MAQPERYRSTTVVFTTAEERVKAVRDSFDELKRLGASINYSSLTSRAARKLKIPETSMRTYIAKDLSPADKYAFGFKVRGFSNKIRK